MSSNGRILDLFDPHMLKLRDIVGKVESLPELVPYHEYSETVLAYKIDTPIDVFVDLLQNSTERLAKVVDREIWTWMAQWQVDNTSTLHGSANTPAQKRLRKTPSAVPSRKSSSHLRGAPADSVEKRVFPPELLADRDLLVILLDILQLQSSVVPNFVEFLYRWIDHFDGDGLGLKCALRREIPSLWDFEDLPILLPNERDELNENLARALPNSTLSDLGYMAQEGHIPQDGNGAQESERLQYREKRYGLQPAKLDPANLPSLINVPTDPVKRTTYFAACYRSRQRALHLILEAGMTMGQVRNYVRTQEQHPKDTSEVGDGRGLVECARDRPYFNHQLLMKRGLDQTQEKWTETQINTRLALEAEQASQSTVAENADARLLSGQLSVPPPRLPDTPLHAFHLNRPVILSDNFAEKLEWFDDDIAYMPSQLCGLVQSKLFSNAKPWSSTGIRHGSGNRNGLESARLGDDEEDDWMNYEYEGDDIDPDLRPDDDEDVVDTVSGAGTAASSQQSSNVMAGQNGHPLPQQQVVGGGNQLTAPTLNPTSAVIPGSQLVPANNGPDINTLNVGLAIPSNQRTPPSPSLSSVQSPAVAALTDPPVPVLLHFPKIILPHHLLIHPKHNDAIMFGHLDSGNGAITLSHAIFLPGRIDKMLLRRAQMTPFTIFETYSRDFGPWRRSTQSANTYEAVYGKLAQSHAIMSESREREVELTKRWTISKDRAFDWDRGAVWEGWAAWIDRPIVMSAEERKGALFMEVNGDTDKQFDDGLNMPRAEELNALMEE